MQKNILLLIVTILFISCSNDINPNEVQFISDKVCSKLSGTLNDNKGCIYDLNISFTNIDESNASLIFSENENSSKQNCNLKKINFAKVSSVNNGFEISSDDADITYIKSGSTYRGKSNSTNSIILTSKVSKVDQEITGDYNGTIHDDAYESRISKICILNLSLTLKQSNTKVTGHIKTTSIRGNCKTFDNDIKGTYKNQILELYTNVSDGSANFSGRSCGANFSGFTVVKGSILGIKKTFNFDWEASKVSSN